LFEQRGRRIGTLERDVIVGPLFTLGAVLVVVAARRRSWLLAGVGVTVAVADQRLPLARRLNRALVDRLYSPPTAEGGPIPTGGDHPDLPPELE
jgi:hypothetical protein